MNEVFYSLSIGLVAFATWFIFDLPALIATSLWIVTSWLIIRSRVFNLLDPRHAKPMTFAPISSPIASSLAAQLHSKMTIQDIEDFVTDRVSHQGIHARMNRVER